jgi:hypothetical protein
MCNIEHLTLTRDFADGSSQTMIIYCMKFHPKLRDFTEIADQALVFKELLPETVTNRKELPCCPYQDK